MKIINYLALTLLMVLVFGVGVAQAEVATTTSTTTPEVVATSTDQVATSTATSTDPTVGSVLRKQLQEKITALFKQIEEIRAAIKDGGNAKDIVLGKLISESARDLRFKRELKLGAKGDDVKLLQKLLATDPDIYPGGFVTGNFGPLTKEALRKLQNKWVIKSDGNLNAETLAKINEILIAAGVEGDIPADLLSNRVKIEIKFNNGNKEVKVQVKPNKDGQDKENDDDNDDESDDNSATSTKDNNSSKNSQKDKSDDDN